MPGGVLPLPERWDGGIREDVPRGAIPPIFGEIADDVEFDSTTGPRERQGYRRLLTELPAAAALRLDGFHSIAVIDPTHTGGSNLVLDELWTMLIEAALRVPEQGTTDPGTFLWEYSEGAANTHNLRVQIRTNSAGEFRLYAEASNAAGTETITVESRVALLLNTVYKFAIRYGGVVGSEVLSVRVLGEEAWINSGSFTGGGTLYQPVDIDGVDIHVHLGGVARQLANQDDNLAVSRFLRIGAVDFHRVRVWKDDYLQLNLGDFPLPEIPTAEYRFTDMSSLRVVDSQGNAPDARIVDVGQNAFAAGTEQIDHRDNVQWELDSPLIGDASLRFDGYTNFARIRDAWKYRQGIKNFDELEEEEDLQNLPEMESYGLAMVVNFDEIRSCGLATSVPVRSTNATTDPESTGDLYFALWLDSDFAGGASIRWTTGNDTGLTEIGTDPGSITLAANTTYLIYVTRDFVEGTASIRVTTSPDEWEYENTQTGLATTHKAPVEGNIFDSRHFKYAMVLGALVKGTRFNAKLSQADDPNDYTIRIHYHRMFKGVMDSFAIFEMERVTGGAGEAPKEFILQLISRDFAQEEISGIAGQFRTLSMFSFNEGARSFLEDRGLLGNHQQSITEPDRNYARSQAGYTVAEAAPPRIDGISEHFDPIKGRKLIAIAGPAVYEIDESSGAATPLGEGIRNDAERQAFMLPFRDDILIATGSRPYRFTGEAVFPLGTETLSVDQIRWGLIHQADEIAAMTEGVRRYRVVYYSSITGEEGDWESEIQVLINRKSSSNVIFGAYSTDDTVNDASVVACRPDQRVAYLDSPTDGPYDITGGVATWSKAVINFRVTGGGPGLSGGHRWGNLGDGTKIAIFRSDVRDPESVSAGELARVLDEKMDMTRVIALRGGLKVRFATSVVGDQNMSANEQASIFLSEVVVGSRESDLYAILGFTSPDTTAVGEDAGHSNKPLPLPSESPHVTHIRFYRTVADGGTFYGAGEVSIGRTPQGYTGGRYWIDDVSDDDLVFRPVMDERKGRPPKCTMMAELSGIMFYAGDEDNPQRLYYSVTGRPEQVEPFAFVDILDGRTLDITGIERYAGGLLIFKEHATLVLTITSSPVFPFRIEMRKPDVGCYGPLAITNVDNALYVGSTEYPRFWDSMTYDPIGYPIHLSWQAIPTSRGRTIVAAHRRQTNEVLFADPEGTTFVYNYRKRAWAFWRNLRMRAAAIVECGTSLDRLIFGDDYGIVYEFDASKHDDGGNLVEDDIGESLTGTGFTIASGDEVTLTGWAVTEADSYAVRGIRLFLSDSGTTDEVRVLYVTSGGALKVEAAPSLGDGSFASGEWRLARIASEFRSGEIRASGPEAIQVQYYHSDMQHPSDWPTGHGVDLVAVVRSGVSAPGELTKSVLAGEDDFMLGFPFRARAFQWGVRNGYPKQPWSVSTMRFEAIFTPRSRAF